MAWPNPNQYAEAVQTPTVAFADPALRSAKVVTTALGLPRPISGNFATVFEVIGSGRKWAVRCFLREVTTHQQRYAAITEHLKSHRLDCMVGFAYLPQGIRVTAKWYPILKMDWTVGVRLDQFIENNLNAPAKLGQMAQQWIALCRALRVAELAHGDLQHGNILITSGDAFKLIDYDGVIIPAVIDIPGGEIGHRHFQHPSRVSDADLTLENFRNVDNFPAHVIGLSLYALSLDPALWARTGAGGENLLFRDDDYNDPNGSKTLRLLRTHSDARVRGIAGRITDVIGVRSYLDVPPLERLEGGKITAISRWLTDHLPQANNDASAPDDMPDTLPEFSDNPASYTAVTRTPEWLRDHLWQRGGLLDFPEDLIEAERERLYEEFQGSMLRIFRPLFRPFAALKINERFLTYPIAAEKSRLEYQIKALDQQMVRLRAMIAHLPNTPNDPKLSAYREVSAADARIAELQQKIAENAQAQQDELDQMEYYIIRALSMIRLEQKLISGFGKARIAALNAAGVFTAADINVQNKQNALDKLSGVRNADPHAEWNLLEAFRRERAQAVTIPPFRFSSTTPEKARARYEAKALDLHVKLAGLQREALASRHRVFDEEQAKLKRFRLEQADLDQKLRTAQASLGRYAQITPAHLLDRIVNG